MDLQVPFYDATAEHEHVGDACASAMRDVVSSGRYIMGPAVSSLEDALAARVGAEYCVAVSSGTDALYMALVALGVRAGDEVATVSFTWISPPEAVALAGATPVFVDVSPHTYCMDVCDLARKLSARTRAIVPVSLFGRAADLASVAAAARAAEARFGTRIAVLEDAAQALGAAGACGSGADAAATSFFPTKPLGCYGDGGAVFVRECAVAQKVRTLRVHGKDSAGRHVRVGLNGRMDTLQAAVLLAKLPCFDRMVEGRRAVARMYEDFLAGERRVITPGMVDGHVYAVYCVRVGRRDEVAKALRRSGVGTAVYYKAGAHTQPVFKDSKVELPVTEALGKCVLALPMHPYLQRDDVRLVVVALVAALDELQVIIPPVLGVGGA